MLKQKAGLSSADYESKLRSQRKDNTALIHEKRSSEKEEIGKLSSPGAPLTCAAKHQAHATVPFNGFYCIHHCWTYFLATIITVALWASTTALIRTYLGFLPSDAVSAHSPHACGAMDLHCLRSCRYQPHLLDCPLLALQ